MRNWMWACGAALVLASAGAYGAHRHADRLTAAEDSLRVAVQDATRQKSLVEFLTTRASLAEQRADAEAARADSLAASARASTTKYVSVKTTAPDTCAPVIRAADQALAGAHAETEAARNALRIAQEAANGYREAKDSAMTALGRLTAAGGAVERERHVPLAERLRPKLVVAATAGVNPFTGRPDAVVGVGLGWSF